jgi:hypothetical protein
MARLSLSRSAAKKATMCSVDIKLNVTTLAFMNYLCFFHDFPIPLWVLSMLRI